MVSIGNRIVDLSELCGNGEATSPDIWSPNLVFTSSTAQSLEEFAYALKLNVPILIQSGSGNGKSFLIREMARRLSQFENLVELTVDNQTDAKSLFGAYVCSEVPGEFIWQQGIVTKAAIKGSWLVIEDVDLVPVDIVASLIPLLERRRLPTPERGPGAEIQVHKHFRIIGTRTLKKYQASAKTQSTYEAIFQATLLGSIPNMKHFQHIWHFVTLVPYSREDIEFILLNRFSNLTSGSIEGLLRVYNLLMDCQDVKSDGRLVTSSNVRYNLIRPYGLKDLIKIANRIQINISGNFNQHSNILTDGQKLLCLQETIDVVASSLRVEEHYVDLVMRLGSCWGVSCVDVQTFIIEGNPQLTLSTKSSDPTVYLGRLCMTRRNTQTMNNSDTAVGTALARVYSHSKHDLRLLEKIGSCVVTGEPVILVGETGSGKTSAVQELARLLNKRLIVQNLSLSTDTGDLLGGFRPVTVRQLVHPIYETFVTLFQLTFSNQQNEEFLQIVTQIFRKQQWKKLVQAFQKASLSASKKLQLYATTIETNSNDATTHSELTSKWAKFSKKVSKFELNLPRIENGFAFSVVDGLLVNAMKNGHWILLDEINLASSETLQSLANIFDGQERVNIVSSGYEESIKRHPDFRVFAAMNPPTDVGKRELPPSLRSRFTEIFSPEMMNPQDLTNLVQQYMSDVAAPISDIVTVYLGCRAACGINEEINLADGGGQRPHYSLRSLTRSMRAAIEFVNIGIKPISRALFEGFLLNFQTLLSAGSGRQYMWTYLKQSFGIPTENALNSPPTRPGGKKSESTNWVLIKPFWLRSGPFQPEDWGDTCADGTIRYVLTKSVEGYIRELGAAVAANVAPILLQGPTSAGKTTMIEYLAARTGHKCVRINNHEHTDIQEYIGGYVTNEQGRLEFRDGLLVQALRRGHWIILDELNLAPSEILEALNRLLDDNKELLISETGEIVLPAEGFFLFATQNPPNAYGGRKPLSRAFRNRFLELCVSDLPYEEVEEIVTKSCAMPPKYSKMLVSTMKELQLRRHQSNVFLGKHGIVTMRDLIKWGRRGPQTPEDVCHEGYMLLAEKLRLEEEKATVLEILLKICKSKISTSIRRTDDSISGLYEVSRRLKSEDCYVEGVKDIAVTEPICRMWKLVSRSMDHNEPTLLIGETGTGKTTICQLYAAYRNQNIRILNCHHSTETADIIGGLRPIRGRESIVDEIGQKYSQLVPAFSGYLECVNNLITEAKLSSIECSDERGDYVKFANLDIIDTIPESSTNLKCIFDTVSKWNASVFDTFKIILQPREENSMTSGPESSKKRKKEAVRVLDLKSKAEIFSTSSDQLRSYITLVEQFGREVMSLSATIQNLYHRYSSLFEWQDGPLITAMKQGEVFVLDEINLAEDSVIERLNSVLESSRTITLAEKGGLDSECIIAHKNFKLFATMNPGGDFGKRELSPALRSRFTEIYVPSQMNDDDVVAVISEAIKSNSNCSFRSQLNDIAAELSRVMLSFINWYKIAAKALGLASLEFSIRELIAWAKFISLWLSKYNMRQGAVEFDELQIEGYCSLFHGFLMVTLDGLGIGQSIPRDVITEFKQSCVDQLTSFCPSKWHSILKSNITPPMSNGYMKINTTGVSFYLGSFSIPVGPQFACLNNENTQNIECGEYVLSAHSTRSNLWRVLRALQISRPILLEGPPGVGKSSLIETLATITGHRLVRINLSEHSELSDLVGTDLPASQTEANNGASEASSDSPQFHFCEGVFLKAMKSGDWVLLDELNLAPQSVLEGLNACLDHRGIVFIPEINRSVHCNPNFRVFCAQNPMAEGGGRKGLPRSFLSRFSRVFIETMSAVDMEYIMHETSQRMMNNSGERLWHRVLETLVPCMASFVHKLQVKVNLAKSFGSSGSPWEFNLRDMIRWLEFVLYHCNTSIPSREDLPHHHVKSMIQNAVKESAYTLFVMRFRDTVDRRAVCDLFKEQFGFDLSVCIPKSSSRIEVVSRSSFGGLPISGTFLKYCEILQNCIDLGWPALLVGSSGVGKRSCVRLLAQASHHRLIEFSASSSTDSTELLGSFEQRNSLSQLHRGLQELKSALSIMLLISVGYSLDLNNLNIKLDDAICKVNALEASDSLCLDNGESIFQDLSDILKSFWEVMQTFMTSPSEYIFSYDVESLSCSIVAAKTCFDRCRQCISAGTEHGFEWVDGVVVNAIQHGHWLLIDNINLCSASVLDRFNTLLERGGSLLLTESGDGRHILTHASFRIFFAMDPCFGEISRAMRNRCAEIHFADSSDVAAVLNNTLNLLTKSKKKISSPADIDRKLIRDSIMYQQIEDLVLSSEANWDKRSSPTISLSIPKFQLFSKYQKLYELECEGFDSATELSHSETIRILSSCIPALAPYKIEFISQLNEMLPLNVSQKEHSVKSDFALFEVFTKYIQFPSRIFIRLLLSVISVSTQPAWLVALVRSAETQSVVPGREHEFDVSRLRNLYISTGASLTIDLPEFLKYLSCHLVSESYALQADVIKIVDKFDSNAGKFVQQSINLLSTVMVTSLHIGDFLGVTESNLVSDDLDSLKKLCLLTDKCGFLGVRRLQIQVSIRDIMLVQRLPILIRQQEAERFVTGVDNLSALEQLPSVYAIAFALSTGRLHSGNKEFRMASALLSLLNKIDAKITVFYLFIEKCKDESFDEIYWYDALSRVCTIVNIRDQLCDLLLNTVSEMKGRTLFSWQVVSVCMRWIENSVTALEHLQPSDNSSQLDSSFLKELYEGVRQFNLTLIVSFGHSDMSECFMKVSKEIWKTGHEAIPSKQDDWKILEEIRRMLPTSSTRCIFYKDSNLTSESYFDMENRSKLYADWLALLATFYWSRSNEWESKDCKLSKNFDLLKITRILQDQFASFNESKKLWDLSYISELENDFDVGSDSFLFFDKRIRNRISFELLSADAASIAAVVENSAVLVLQRVTNSMANIFVSSVSVTSVNDMVADLKIFILAILRYTDLYPHILREIQSLLWVLESALPQFSQLSEISLSDNHELIDYCNLHSITKFYRSVSGSLDAHLHKISYRSINNFDISPTYDSITIHNILTATNKNEICRNPTTSSSWSMQSFSGPTKQLQLITLENALRHLDIRVFCPRYFREKTKGSFNFATVGSAELNVSTCKFGQRCLFRLLRSIVCTSNLKIGFNKPQDNHYEQIVRLSLLHWNVQDIFVSCQSVFDVETWDSVKSIIHTNDPRNIKMSNLAILHVHQKCKDSYISDLMELCLQPVLEFLAIATFSESDESRWIRAGEAWTHIGMMKMHLFMLPAPVDPATVPASKAYILSNIFRTKHIDMIVQHRVAVLESASYLTNKIFSISNELDTLSKRIEKLKTKSIERPLSAAHFDELYFDLKDVLESFGNISRLKSLLERVAEHATSPPSDDRYRHLKSCSDEEIGWQSAALSCIERLSAKYSEYKDVLSPFFSAFQNISFGLRFSIGTTVSKAEVMHSTGNVNGSRDIFNWWRELLLCSFIDIKSPIHMNDLMKQSQAVVRRAMSQLQESRDINNIISNYNVQYPTPSLVESKCSYLLLLLYLYRMDFFIQTKVTACNAIYSNFMNGLSQFVDVYLITEKVKRQKVAEKATLYKYRKNETIYESNDEKEEAEALKKHFPDHLTDIKKLMGMPAEDRDIKMTLEGKFLDDETDGDDEKLEKISVEFNVDTLAVDEETVKNLVMLHARMILFHRTQSLQYTGFLLAPGVFPKATVTATGNTQSLRHASQKNKIYSAIPISTSHNSKSFTNILPFITPNPIASLKQICFLSCKALQWSVHNIIAPNLDTALKGGSLMMIGEMAQVMNISSNKYYSPAWNPILLSIDRDLLFLLDSGSGPHSVAIGDQMNVPPTVSIDCAWNPLDFHQDAWPAEIVLANPALVSIYERSSELLVEYPGNELLLQVLKLSVIINNYHITTPLGKMLSSVEMLLKKAEEWEKFAARHSSLQSEMTKLSELISRWRQTELRCWEHLLRCKEVEYAREALKFWFILAKTLQAVPNTYVSRPQEKFAPTGVGFRWNYLFNSNPVWLWGAKFSSINISASGGPDSNESATGEYQIPKIFQSDKYTSDESCLQLAFTTVDGFLRSSNVGQFPMRLHIIRVFALQLIQDTNYDLDEFDVRHDICGYDNLIIPIQDIHLTEVQNNGALNLVTTPQRELQLYKKRLGRALFGVWQYYQQYLQVVRSFQTALKSPVQQKVKDQAKIGKWDQLSAYALIEHSERVHRKLNTLIREYQQDVLEYPVSAVMGRDVMKGFASEQGDLNGATTVPTSKEIFDILPQLGEVINSFSNDGIALDDGESEFNTAAKQPVEHSSKDVHLPATSRFMFSSSLFDAVVSNKSDQNDLYTDVKHMGELAGHPRLLKIPNLRAKIAKYVGTSLILKLTDESDYDPTNFECKCRHGMQAAVLAEVLCRELFTRLDSIRGSDVTRVMKRRAMLDLLSALKDQGFSTYASVLPAEIHNTVSILGVNSPLPIEIGADLLWSSGIPRTQLEQAERYYMRNITELNQLRTQAAAPFSKDVTLRDVQHMLGLSDNIFFNLIRSRAVLGAAFNDLKSIIGVLIPLKDFAENSRGRDKKELLNDVVNIKRWDLEWRVKYNSFIASYIPEASMVILLINQLKDLVSAAVQAQHPEMLEEQSAFPVLEQACASAAEKALQTLTQSIQNSIEVMQGSSAYDETNLNAVGRDMKGIPNNSSHLLELVDGYRFLVEHLSSDEARRRICKIEHLVNNCYCGLNRVKEHIFTLVSADVGAPMLSKLELWVNRILLALHLLHDSKYDDDLNAAALEAHNDDTAWVDSLSLCVDECLLAVQKLQAVSGSSFEPNRGYSSTPAILSGIQGCFGEQLFSRDALLPTLAHSADANNQELDRSLGECITLSHTGVAAVGVHIAAITNRLNGLISSAKENVNTSAAKFALVANTCLPLFEQLTHIYSALIDDACAMYKSTGKLLYVCLRVFRTLLAKGLCSDEVDEGEGGGGGADMTFQDDVDGTGMGEGDGKKDVSNEIQNEDQLMGLKNDEKENEKAEAQPESKKLENVEEDKAVEMSNDFNGDMYDLPEDREATEDDNEDEGVDKEELERELGAADMEDIVDERQWDNDDGDDGPQGEEKFEKDSKTKGPALNGEMRTRDDSDDDAEGDENSSPTEKNYEDAQTESANENDCPDIDVNEFDKNEVQDKPTGVDVREEAEKNVDKENEEAEDSGLKDIDGNDPEGPFDDLNSNYDANSVEGEELPDNMQIDDGPDEDQADRSSENENNGDEADDEINQNNPDPANLSNDGSDEVADQLSDSLAGSGASPEEQKLTTPTYEEEKEEVPKALQAREPRRDLPAAFGTASQAGKDSILDGDQTTEQEASTEQSHDSKDATGAKGSMGASQSSGRNGSAQNIEEQEKVSKFDWKHKLRMNIQRNAPNPFSAAGDINEKWHRHLNLLDRDDDESDDDNAESITEANKSSHQDPASKSAGLYEKIRQDEQGTEQVLDTALGEDEEAAMMPSEKQCEDRFTDSKSNKNNQDDIDDIAQVERAPPLDPERRKRKNGTPDKQTQPKRPRDESNESGPDNHFDELGAVDAMDDKDKLSMENDEDMQEGKNESEPEVPTFRDRITSNHKFIFGHVTESKEAENSNTEVDVMEFAKSDPEQLGRAREEWTRHRQLSEGHASRLCEQLRLILEPTVASRLRGDYRSGKRLNMRRIIGYVASGFRKDKIWQRRTKAAKREYQVMLMVDNSRSMAEAGPLAMSAVATITGALTRLEAGDISLVSFAEDIYVVHPFGQPFTDEAGAKACVQFDFSADRTMLGRALQAVGPIFEESRRTTSFGTTSADAILQLCFVISDARIDSDNRKRLESTIRDLSEQNVLVLLVIIDKTDQRRDSIFNTKSVEFIGNKVVSSSYMDNFPFPYYVAIEQLEGLSETLSDALKQWLEMVRNQQGC